MARKVTLKWRMSGINILSKTGANLLPCRTLALVRKVSESMSSQRTAKERSDRKYLKLRHKGPGKNLIL